ncbi:MAG: hypothetical protein JNN20_11100 [Betaproteobacteria bacterium]|nr:hypothetical protein [Betaproteobacteria bacterium]
MRLNERQLSEIRRLLNHIALPQGLMVPEQFLLKYILVEALLRYVLDQFGRQIEKDRPTSSSHSPLRIDSVRKALTSFHVRIPTNCLDLLLDSKRKARGVKSARNLRNGLVHAWDANDTQEVIDREAELMAALSTFLSTFDIYSQRGTPNVLDVKDNI